MLTSSCICVVFCDLNPSNPWEKIITGKFPSLKGAESLNVSVSIRSTAFAINLGTGKGNSVLDVVKCFQKILKSKIKIKYTKRRKGDLSVNYADVYKARKYLKWKAKFNLYDMCKSFCVWKKLI